jgi:hypothetical protein
MFDGLEVACLLGIRLKGLKSLDCDTTTSFRVSIAVNFYVK